MDRTSFSVQVDLLYITSLSPFAYILSIFFWLHFCRTLFAAFDFLSTNIQSWFFSGFYTYTLLHLLHLHATFYILFIVFVHGSHFVDHSRSFCTYLYIVHLVLSTSRSCSDHCRSFIVDLHSFIPSLHLCRFTFCSSFYMSNFTSRFTFLFPRYIQVDHSHLLPFPHDFT